MKRLTLIAVALLLLVVTQTAVAQSADIRVERLAGLGRVWNTAKYFHPYLAERNIDWDKALIDAIPRVNSANTPGEYRDAIGGMLAVLGDKASTVSIAAKSATPQNVPPPVTDPVRSVDGILIIDVTAIARAIAADVSQRSKPVEKIRSLLPAAKGVIFDCRSMSRFDLSEDDASGFFFDDFLNTVVPMVVAGDITLGADRYRTHNGYAPQSGTTSGGYYSSIVTDTPTVISGQAAATLPIGFVVNTNSPDEARLWCGLHAAGLASIVQEGDLQVEFGSSGTSIPLAEGVTATVRVGELVSPDGTVGFHSDKTVAIGGDALKEAIAIIGKPVKTPLSPTVGAIAASSKEKAYADMQFPSAEYRLLALFRYWGVIDKFYPYKELISDTWPTVLPRFIPKFEADKDALDYQKTIYELSAEIHDSHGFIRNAGAFDEMLGAYIPPVLVRYIDGHAVVTRVLDDKTPLKPGDVIEEIDGRPEIERRDMLGRFYSASTPQALLRVINTNLLRGPKDSSIKLTARTGDEKPRTLEVPRSMLRVSPVVQRAYLRTTPVVEVLSSGFGYVDLGRLQVAEVDAMFKKILPTKGVIFDMRGYPNGTAWEVAPRLTDKTGVPAALFSRPIVNGRELNDGDLGRSSRYSFAQTLPVREGERYRGTVVMLIDETAISQAEHTCLFFESATNVTFIGTPTSGANGDVTNVVVPGGLLMSFSGQAVRHIDGRQLQRLGIQPTIKSAPTIAGIAAGRDEVLDAAVDYLKRTVK